MKVLLALAGAAFLAVPAEGQRLETRGRVVAADSEKPVPGAAVRVLGTELETITAADGGFRVLLPTGEAWSVVVWHIGYAPDTVDVPVGGSANPLIVRLTPMPIALRGIAARGGAPRGTYTLTPATVRQAPPLGEPDLLRAIALLPHASQPNDLKGRIHLDGGSSDETGIRLDGHPLLEPFHLLGLLSAFPLNALERADVHSHHLPPAQGGHLSGIIAMRTARAGSAAKHEATVSVGAATATFVREGPLGTDLLASGRITYLDRLGDLAKLDSDFPRYGFRDGLLRVGRTVGGWRAEVLAFGTRDRFRDPDLERLGPYEPLTWGETLLGTRIERHGQTWSLAARGSFGRARTRLDERLAGRNNMIDLQRDWWSAEARLGFQSLSVSGNVGFAFDSRYNRQEWNAPGLVDEVLSRSAPPLFVGVDSLQLAAFWAEAVWRPAAALRLSTGARATRTYNDWFIAPRIELSATMPAGASLRIAADRRFQFDALVEEPIEGSASAPVFFLEHPRRADVLSILFEHASPIRSVSALTLEAGVNIKRYSDRPLLAVPDSTSTTAPAFPAFRRTEGAALGMIASARLELSGQKLVVASYRYQRVRETFDGSTTPTSWDLPHSITMVMSWPLGSAWTVTSVFQAHSGPATTPVVARVFAPRLEDGPARLVPSRYLFGDRNSIRVPAYRRLDVGLRRRWAGRIEWVLSLQILNVLGGGNPIDYDWLQYYRSLDSGTGEGTRNGLPFLPTIGLEVRW